MRLKSIPSLKYAKALLALVGIVGFTASTQASTTVLWDFTGGSAAGVASGDDADQITANDATIGPGISGTSQGGFSSVTNSTFYTASATTDTEAGAVADGDYIEFSFSVEPGYIFSVNSLNFTVGANTSAGVGAFTVTHFLRADAESSAYSTTLGSDSYDHAGDSNINVRWSAPFTINTSANPDFSGLTSLTFRIYQHDTINSTGAWGRGDNVSADITVIPEPAVLGLLLSLGAFAVVLVRRKRRSE